MYKEPYIGMPINLSELNDKDEADNNAADFGDMKLSSLPLAMSYVPFQKWNSTYPLDEVLAAGTIFPDLNLPFEGGMTR